MAALYSMQRVYQLRSMPAWNSIRTLLEFTTTGVGLGCSVAGSASPQGNTNGYYDLDCLGGYGSFPGSPFSQHIQRSDNTEYDVCNNGEPDLTLAGILCGVTIILIGPHKIGIELGTGVSHRCD